MKFECDRDFEVPKGHIIARALIGLDHDGDLRAYDSTHYWQHPDEDDLDEVFYGPINRFRWLQPEDEKGRERTDEMPPHISFMIEDDGSFTLQSYSETIPGGCDEVIAAIGFDKDGTLQIMDEYTEDQVDDDESIVRIVKVVHFVRKKLPLPPIGTFMLHRGEVGAYLGVMEEGPKGGYEPWTVKNDRGYVSSKPADGLLASALSKGYKSPFDR